MAEHCANCRSTDVQAGLDGHDCLACGAVTVNGAVTRPPQSEGLTTTKTK